MDNRHRAIFLKRIKTLKKKAKELSILCDIPVALLCCDSDDEDVETWPEDSDAVCQILLKFYRGRDDMISKILESDRNASYPSWCPELDFLTEEPLREILENVNDTLKKIEAKTKDDYKEDNHREEEEQDDDQEEEENGVDSAITELHSVPTSSTCTNSSNQSNS